MKIVLAALLAGGMAVPAWAGGVTRSEAEQFDFSRPFEEAKDRLMLRSLLERALEAIVDRIEVHGRLKKDEDGSDREGRFELRLYPEGKSRSDDHVSAEGGFRLSPDGDSELSLRFKSFKEPPQETTQHPADYL